MKRKYNVGDKWYNDCATFEIIEARHVGNTTRLEIKVIERSGGMNDTHIDPTNSHRWTKHIAKYKLRKENPKMLSVILSDGSVLEFDDGQIRFNDILCGSLRHHLKFGYHPVVHLNFSFEGMIEEFIELDDTPVQKSIKLITQHLNVTVKEERNGKVVRQDSKTASQDSL